MSDIYKNIDEYGLNKDPKILNVLYDLIADILSNRKLQQQNLIITYKKIIIYQIKKIKHFSCFHDTILFYCTKNIGLSFTYYFIMEIPNKQKPQ